MIKQSLMLAAATLALAACNKPASETAADAGAATSNAADATGSAVGNAADAVSAAVTPTPTAAEFVQKAAISDMYEIESSKLAQKMSKSAAVTKFAGEMIKAHTATTAQIKTITAGDAALKPPAALDEDHAKLIADLKAATPDTFDTLYVDQQTSGHSDTLSLMKSYADAGDNAKLKAFAAETAPKVQMHLDMVKQIDHSGVPDSQAGNANAKP
jgi:putative membrane protein